MVDSEFNGWRLLLTRAPDARSTFNKECHIITPSTQRATPRRPLVIGGTAFALVLILDQLSKWIVFETIGPNGTRDYVQIIPGVLQFDFVRNTGSAFGLFQGNSEILKILALGAVIGLFIYYARSAARDWVIALALGLQLGGALGNIIDRFRHGYVVDFIDFPRFPTFNVADSAITIGVGLLMIAILFRDDHSRVQADRVVKADQIPLTGDDV